MPVGAIRLRRPRSRLDGGRTGGHLRLRAPSSRGRTGVGAARRARLHTVRPLANEEVDALWPLVVLRTSVTASGQYDTLSDPGNSYASAALDREWAMFEAAVSVPAEVMTAQLRHALGRPSAQLLPVAEHTLLPGLPDDVASLDLSVSSEELHTGRRPAPDAETALARAALTAGHAAVRTRHGEFRLTRTTVDDSVPAATCALGVELHLTGPAEIRAPWAGTVTRHGDACVTLHTGGLDLLLDGVDAEVQPGPVVSGRQLGTVAAREGVRVLGVQLLRPCATGGRPPRFAPPELAAGWLEVCPDPTRLFLVPDASDAPGAPAVLRARRRAACARVTQQAVTEAELLERREHSFATVQEHYFETPPQIERGWRHHLVDTRGRGYLDMLNNVTILGHGHPGLGEAVHRQWQRLNTNSRFHYASVVELSERLTNCSRPSWTPCSWSTAVPRPWTSRSGSRGRRPDDRTWSRWRRPTTVGPTRATRCRPRSPTTRTRSPHDRRGCTPSRHPTPTGAATGDRGRGALPKPPARIRELADQGRPLAAFVCEPYYGNAGGMALPDGYLRQVYEATRDVGGLCVADEVQVGYGRLGSHFWGFEQQGVVPDIVTVAKAMGNGHPLGAVITRREVADAYRTQGYFFSSAGGSPVSSVVGLTVLDALRDEDLQTNAREIGAHLKDRLLELAERHALIGAVHGLGLYLGVEFVPRTARAWNRRPETAAICDRLRELGVIVQPTSDRQCVLKIKPPLCLTRRSADVFADALDDVLTHGW